MQKSEFYFNGPALIRYSDECQSLRAKADRLAVVLRRARLYAAGEHEWEYTRMIRTAEALERFFSGMSKAASSTYDDASDASRKISRMLEEHVDTMRSIHIIEQD